MKPNLEARARLKKKAIAIRESFAKRSIATLPESVVNQSLRDLSQPTK